jgi:hypothetical protein
MVTSTASNATTKGLLGACKNIILRAGAARNTNSQFLEVGNAPVHENDL